MKKLAIIALLLSTSAYAEDVKPDATAPATAVVPAKPTPPYFFMMDDADLNVIAAGLNELKKREADPFLMKLQGQLNDQAKIKAEAAKGK